MNFEARGGGKSFFLRKKYEKSSQTLFFEPKKKLSSLAPFETFFQTSSHPPLDPSGPTASFDPSEQRNPPRRTREHDETERSELFDDDGDEEEEEEEEKEEEEEEEELSFVSLTELGVARPASMSFRRRPRKNGRSETFVGG